MLAVRGIESHYGASQALFGVSLSVKSGEVVTLIGRNGMGKTTSINSIMGITKITRGEIFLENQPINDLESFKINRMGIALVPEGRQVFPNLTVRENLVAIAANRNKHANPWNLEKILNLFPLLSARIDNMANLLSGGEQQMMAIGRALMSRPKMILLDEPSMGLAPQLVEEIFEIVKDLNQKEGVSFLLAEQNTNIALKYATYGYILENGRVVMDGTAEDLKNNEDVKEFYLGVGAEGRASFRDVKHYRRRKRWLG